MEYEIRNSKEIYYGEALKMSKEEKTISFFNQYFIYKKVRNLTLEQYKQLWNKNIDDSESELQDNLEETISNKKVAKKIPGKKIVLSLDNYAPIKEKEEPPVAEISSDLGEFQSSFDRLNKEVQAKLKKYPVEVQIAMIKKMQAPKNKVVTALK
jgi:hypothetical protein